MHGFVTNKLYPYSTDLSVCLYVYIYLYVCLSVCLSVSLSVCLSIWQSSQGNVHTEAVILTGQVPTKCLGSHIYVFAAMTNLPFV
jgi:hypothetical protein